MNAVMQADRLLSEGQPAAGNPKLRLLCVGRSFGGGGAERIQLTLLEHLDRSRFDIDVFYLSSSGPLRDLLPADLVPTYADWVAANSAVVASRVLTRLVRLAKTTDVIFAMQEGAPTYFAGLAGAVTGRPVVSWLHRGLSEACRKSGAWRSRVARSLYRLVQRVVTVSEGVRENAVALSPRLRGRVCYLPSPLPLGRIDRLAQEGLPEWAGSVFCKGTLLATGRLSPEKGFDVLLQAFQRIVRSGVDINLLILGDGPERERLAGMVGEMSLQGRVFMPGYQLNPYPFFRRADVFVLSSRSEGMPTVLLEALHLGVPVVSTDCPYGPSELLDGGRYGVLVPPCDESALASSVAGLVSSRQDLARFGELGPTRASAYDARAATRAFEEMFLRVRWAAASVPGVSK